MVDVRESVLMKTRMVVMTYDDNDTPGDFSDDTADKFTWVNWGAGRYNAGAGGYTPTGTPGQD